DLGLAVDTFYPRTEALALAAVEDGVENRTERAANPAFGNLGPILGPIRFYQAGARILRLDGEALFAPEIDDLWVNLLGGLVDDQPADVAIAHDFDALGLRQDAIAVTGILRRLLAFSVLAEGCRAFRGPVVSVAISLGQIGRNAQGIARHGAFVVDSLFTPHRLIQGGAARRQDHCAHAQCQDGAA